MSTAEEIIGELDEAGGHAFKASLAVIEGERHKAIEELTSAIERMSWAAELIKKEMKK
jgi:hypothetical protein